MKNLDQALQAAGIKPDEDQEYFYINEYGKVEMAHWSIFNEEHDIKRLRHGNVFKTREAAQTFINKHFPKK